jgi:primosomal protein N' (replication factor Y) (superfamily II helicase)
MYAEVAVPAPLAHALTYRVPEALQAHVQPGSRVVVELGRRRVFAVVLGLSDTPPRPSKKAEAAAEAAEAAGAAGAEAQQAAEAAVREAARGALQPSLLGLPEELLLAGNTSRPPKARKAPTLKDVLDVVDREPVVQPELLRFLVELAQYYFAPIGEVMKLALPALERDDAARAGGEHEVSTQGVHLVGGKKLRYARATDQLEAPGSLKGNAAAVLALLRSAGELPVAKLAERWSNARTVVEKLSGLGLVSVEEREPPRDPFFREGVARDEVPEPTEAQSEAMGALEGALKGGEGGAFLLHGVTGSGKTEVYLHAIAAARALGKGALVLVPEIALTPQLVSRFRARFGDELAVLHSGLKRHDRHAMWQSVRQGRVQVAIGARSALFAPIPDLGLLIVDEEHDSSFKQEEGVRYHARDMALLRAHRARAVCVLGSATPSLETEHLARTHKITRLRLPVRARASAMMPQVITIDLRRTGPGPNGDARISLPLHRKIVEVLGRKEQIILFLNRRGFAPSVVCEACGLIATCPSCSVALTFHQRQKLMRCHYCDYEQRFGGSCMACTSNRIALEGLGTERLEESVRVLYPDARVARLDRDVASGNKAEPILEQLRKHEIDILIGTQMVAKGHDVAKVTLVGVINADAALSMPDMRATERAFQLLVQVAGRAGRGEVRGTVMLQTRDPKNPAIVSAATHDVDGFAMRELQARAELGYPPFSRLCMVRVDAPEEGLARDVAASLAEAARAVPVARGGAVEVLGPAPSPIARLRARYRFQLLLKARERKALRAVAIAVIEAQRKVDRQVRVVVDVDPVSML